MSRRAAPWACLCALALGCATARPPPARAFAAFVDAFNAGDLPAFMAAFEEDATIFFDLDDPGGRIQGRAAIEKVFAPFFGRGLQLRPVDTLYQRAGDVAVLTFHLRGDASLARRTLVWRFAHGRWRVLHLHASSVELDR